jgi:hypothetical protein
MEALGINLPILRQSTFISAVFLKWKISNYAATQHLKTLGLQDIIGKS